MRLAVINVFDRSYELRDGSGIGVGAPQFGRRRAFYVTPARRSSRRSEEIHDDHH